MSLFASSSRHHITRFHLSPSVAMIQSIMSAYDEMEHPHTPRMKPTPLNVTFCDHEGVFAKPDLLRSATPPPSLSPTKGQIRRFEFNNEHPCNQSIDDSAVPFLIKVQEHKSKLKKLKQQKAAYTEKLKQYELNHSNVAVPISSSKLMTSKLQEICNTKLCPRVRAKSDTLTSLRIPSLPLHKLKESPSGVSSAGYTDNRFAIGWNFLNQVTKQTLLSDDGNASQNLDRLKSFVSYSSMVLTFNHYSARWQNAEDIRNLSALTTNRYRKCAVDLAATVVDREQLNMNALSNQYAAIPPQRFKKTLRACYQILDHRPESVRPTMYAIPLFLPSLNIVFDPSPKEIAAAMQQTEHAQKLRRHKHLLEKKRKRLQQTTLKLRRLKQYKNELKRWHRTRGSLDNKMEKTPYISMMSFDDGKTKRKEEMSEIVMHKDQKSTIASSVRIPTSF